MTPRSLAEEAADPSTTPQRMREIIQTDRSLYAAVACNPNVDEPLRQWLWTNGGREVQEAMVRQYEEAVRAQEEAREAQKAAQADLARREAEEQKAAEERAAREAEERAAREREEAGRKAAEERAAREAEERARQEEALRAQAAAAQLAEAEGLKAAQAEAQARAAAEAEARTSGLFAQQGAGADAAEAARREEEQREAAAQLAAIEAEAKAGRAEKAKKAAAGSAAGTGAAASAGAARAAASRPGAQAQAQPDSAESPEDDFDEEAEKTVVVDRSKRPASTITTAEGQSVALTEDIVILGRKPRGAITRGAQVVKIKDSERTISKTHARLTWHDDAWFITDLNSTNGVTVGDEATGIEISPDEEVELVGPFALGLHQMSLDVEE